MWSGHRNSSPSRKIPTPLTDLRFSTSLTPWPAERLLLYVGLNCAMGQPNWGGCGFATSFWSSGKHEHASRLDFDSSGGRNSFLRCLRAKTTVFGEWLLWPETVQMVQWSIARRKKIPGFGPTAVLVGIPESAAPWYSEGSKNPQVRFTNVWNDLIPASPKREGAPGFPATSVWDTPEDAAGHHPSSFWRRTRQPMCRPWQRLSGRQPAGLLHEQTFRSAPQGDS